MCTPHDLINSDLLGKNREPHFGHKGSDLALFRRNYWFKFWSYERKNGFSAKCVENSGSWFLEQEVLRLERMLEEKQNRYSGTTQKTPKQPPHKKIQTNKTLPKTQRNRGNENFVGMAQEKDRTTWAGWERDEKRCFLQKETFERAENH